MKITKYTILSYIIGAMICLLVLGSVYSCTPYLLYDYYYDHRPVHRHNVEPRRTKISRNVHTNQHTHHTDAYRR